METVTRDERGWFTVTRDGASGYGPTERHARAYLLAFEAADTALEYNEADEDARARRRDELTDTLVGVIRLAASPF